MTLHCHQAARMLAAATISRWTRPLGLASDIDCRTGSCRKKLYNYININIRGPLAGHGSAADQEGRPLALALGLLSDASRYIPKKFAPSLLIPPACSATKGSTVRGSPYPTPRLRSRSSFLTFDCFFFSGCSSLINVIYA